MLNNPPVSAFLLNIVCLFPPVSLMASCCVCLVRSNFSFKKVSKVNEEMSSEQLNA